MDSESGDEADNEQTVVFKKKVDPKLAGRTRVQRRKVQSSDEEKAENEEPQSAGEMDDNDEQ